MGKFRTTPHDTNRMPPGIPFIVANECAERFSFYGMKAILTVFMTKYLMDRNGELATMDEETAKGYYHLFTMAAYFFPVVGALLADALWGKYKTILWISLGYCFGHAALAIDETRVGLFVGLTLIALGAGGIKSCVAANVGDQFGPRNKHLISKVFSWFYFAINLGAAASSLITPILLDRYGPTWAFGVPGILMALALLFFWMGRHKYTHVPPAGMGFFREMLSGEGLRAMLNLSIIYLFIAMFWALFDQTGSAWVLQAEKMDRNFLGIEWLESQVQFVNPVLILTLIPVFTYIVYPAINKVFKLTPIRKIAIGMFVTVLAFAISAWIEQQIDAGKSPNIGWQFLAYFVLTSAEVMVSITALEFSYTQAPRKMKSLILGLFYLSVSVGNLFTAAVNFFIKNDDGTSKLDGADYYWFFTITMLVTAALFVVYAPFYRGKTYIQGEDDQGNAIPPEETVQATNE